MERSLVSVCNPKGLQEQFILQLAAVSYLWYWLECSRVLVPTYMGFYPRYTNGLFTCVKSTFSGKKNPQISGLFLLWNLPSVDGNSWECFSFSTSRCFDFWTKSRWGNTCSPKSRGGTWWDKSKRRMTSPLWNSMSQPLLSSQTLCLFLQRDQDKAGAYIILHSLLHEASV